MTPAHSWAEISAGYTDYELLRRLLARVERDEITGCWNWIGDTAPNGYGVFTLRRGGKRRRPGTHRVAHFLMVGPLRDEQVVDHTCRNRACVNPYHLRAVDQGTNFRSSGHYSAVASATDVCVSGRHRMVGDNVFVAQSTGLRRCRECRREYMRRKYQEARAAA